MYVLGLGNKTGIRFLHKVVENSYYVIFIPITPLIRNGKKLQVQTSWLHKSRQLLQFRKRETEWSCICMTTKLFPSHPWTSCKNELILEFNWHANCCWENSELQMGKSNKHHVTETSSWDSTSDCFTLSNTSFTVLSCQKIAYRWFWLLLSPIDPHCMCSHHLIVYNLF